MRPRQPIRAKLASLSIVAATVVAASACNRSSETADPPARDQPGVTAPQASAAPGSPSATRSIDSTHLPPRTREVRRSHPARCQSSRKRGGRRSVKPPKGAPNVLLIMTDDVGFAAPSTFGGVIPTPTLDRIAKAGLRYTAFHSTALCSPTRAALITGRNHHSVHTGVVVEQATGFPGYDTLIEKDTATIGQILKENGYSTAWFGKDHNTPIWESTPAGPFERWPIGIRLSILLRIRRRRRQPVAAEPLSEHDGDRAVHRPPRLEPHHGDGRRRHPVHEEPQRHRARRCRSSCTTSPAAPTPRTTRPPSGSISSRASSTWAGTRCATRSSPTRRGSASSRKTRSSRRGPRTFLSGTRSRPRQKKLFARQAEVYAAYLAYTDYEIGRVVPGRAGHGQARQHTRHLHQRGQRCEPGGHARRHAQRGRLAQRRDHPRRGSDEVSTTRGAPTRRIPTSAVGWAWAFDTPFQWTKQVASHFGGTRQGVVMAWPARIKDVGGIRNQFSHVIDVVPTILEAAGIAQPQIVDGIPQRPIEGVSMAYTWDKTNADAPTRHTTQYFEMFGSRAIYHDGWIAAAPPLVPPWEMGKPSPPPDAYKWELYNRTTTGRRATTSRRRSRTSFATAETLHDRGDQDTTCFPLSNNLVERLIAAQSPSPTAGRNVFTYSGRARQRRLGGRAEPARPVVHDHRRRRGSAGWRGRHARHAGRPLRRIRLLPAQRPAGVRLERWST